MLVDTSVWIDFFRGARRAARLGPLLEENEVVIHPWVVGELALGTLGRKRQEILVDLQRLPPAAVVPDREILELAEARRLHGRGIGWVDTHLLGSALVSGVPIWSFDRRLAEVASELGLAA